MINTIMLPRSRRQSVAIVKTRPLTGSG